MLDIRFIRENPDIVKKAVQNKNSDVDIDKLLEVDEKRRKFIGQVDDFRAKQNLVSDQIAQEKDENIRSEKIEEMQHLKRDLHDVEGHLAEIELEFKSMMMEVPNIPFDDVPVGRDESFNEVLREVGDRPKFSFEPKDYMTLAQTHDWIDVERASKIAGTRFSYLRRDLPLLEFAIVTYTMNKLAEHGFIPCLPPVFIKPEYMDAMGFLHGATKDDVYFLEQDQMYLVGTSEQSIGPMHAGETLPREYLPLRYAGFSTCFRREAGSYGKDTKGILRVHQFDKVEMISFSAPEKSREEHKFLLSLNEAMMQELGLPYRVIHICTGDLGLSKAEQFDIETWIPSEGRYRETHSASNTTDFQARRLGIKTKNEEGDTVLVHMLNDTAFAIGRILIAIIENFQQEDGSVRIPDALVPYFGAEVMPKSK
ncbi:MAG: serine--tRNA ligase [Candidatus Spechtbacteria bacterium]|nr:serine--tRNA ligase [Candidatus Spechtbacteria bacterium]